MATTIITKNGTGAPLASDLVAGELAVDLTNKRLYTEDSGGTIIEVGTNPSGAVTFNSNATFSGTAEAQFRDSALKVSSSVDGQLDIDADVELEITAPTVDIDASTAVTIDTATLTVTGAANVTGDLDVDNININGNAIISTDTNGNIDLTPNGTGEVNISKVDIDAGAIDGTAIGANSASTGAFTTLTASTSLNIASSTTVDGVLDEDTMSSNSATKLATQQSIKAYVDSQVGANNELSEVLANGNTTGSTNIVVTAGQSITTDSILETTAAAGVDIDGVLLKDTSVGTDDASGTDVAGTAVTVKGGAGTGTGAGGSLVFQTAPAGTTGSSANAQVTALTIDSAGDATFTGASYNMSWDKSANSLAFADNAKAVFGAGSDLQIYHDGSNSYIDDTGTGNLFVRASDNFYVQNAAGTETKAAFTTDGAVKLYYNGGTKFQTVSGGIDVTGTVTADGLTVDGNPIINGASPQLFFQTGALHYNWQLAAQENLSGAFEISSGDADASAPDDTYTKRLIIQNNGDISFYEDTGTTAKLFWDASAESLGIGTTSPNSYSFNTGTILAVGQGANDTISVVSSPAGSGHLAFADGTSGTARYSGLVQYSHSTDSMRLFTAGNERMRIDSSGAVIVNNGGTGNGLIKINGATGSTEALIFQRGGTEASRIGHSNSADLTFSTGSGATERMRIDSSGLIQIGNAGSSSSPTIQSLIDPDTGIFFGGANILGFSTGGTERMRLDGGGNLLVGATTTTNLSDGTGNDGVQLNPSGTIAAARTSNVTAVFNRLSTDGEIARFNKDGTTVGSIGADYTGTSAAGLFIGNGTNGLFFNGSADIIQPYSITGGENVDNTIDLGNSAKRFKDLYLAGDVIAPNIVASNGVFLGGTGVANKLDDYETGTWTPTVAGDATGLFGAAEGYYTKVGRLVFIELYFTVGTNFTSNTVGGLPFTVANLATGTSYGQSAVVLTSAADTVTGAAQEATTNATFYNDHNILSTHAPNTTNSAYRLSLCYQAA